MLDDTADDTLIPEPHLEIEVKAPIFNYLWTKYVTGFDARWHCAKGLLGQYSKILPYKTLREPKLYRQVLDEHPFRYVYLCGNTGDWATNIHLALERSPGEIVEFEDERVRIEVIGMRRLPIEPIVSPPKLGPEYLTCRNYQFGWQYFDGAAQWRRLEAQRLLF